MGVGGQRHALAALPPRKTRYPLYMRLGGLQGRSGRVWKISPPPGFDPWAVQPILYTRLYVTDVFAYTVLYHTKSWASLYKVTSLEFHPIGLEKWGILPFLTLMKVSFNMIIWCVEKKNQLDVTECFIGLMICSTCFWHFYAHHQELETICVLLPPMVCSAWLLVVAG